MDTINSGMIENAMSMDVEYFKEANGCYVFYHLTDLSNMGMILSQGLCARVGSRTAQSQENAGVYVFMKAEDAEDARDSWLGSDIEAVHMNEFGDVFRGFAVFELHVPIEFVKANGMYALEYGYELKFACDVPKEYIRTVTHDDDTGLRVRWRKVVMSPITIDVIEEAREVDSEYFTEVNGCYVFYHITDGIHMDSVLENGLYSKIGTRSAEMFDESGVFVFLSESDSADGMDNWLGDLLEEEHEELYGEELEDFARFEIHVPIDFVMAYGRYTMEVGYELMFASSIPKEFIVGGEYV